MAGDPPESVSQLASPERRYESIILIVDDNAPAREVLATLLSTEGYRLSQAATGLQALAMAAEINPDLILLDVMMPDMDGFEVCRRLRADATLALVPVIMVTALDHQVSMVRGLESGADDFIAKPYNYASMRARVRTIIRLNRYRLLLEERRRADIHARRLAEELASAYDSALEGWSRALDLRDHETEGHSRRVTDLTVELATALGLSSAEVEHARRGALLHDIGKMGVPDAILRKPGPLSDEEWVVMRRHPTYAYELLRPIDFLADALAIPYCHHEKWDGSGYPRGLRGEEIPLAARIFAVIDVWDALSNDRPYKAAWPADRVSAHLRAQAGIHFDPAVVDAFLDLPSIAGERAGEARAGGEG